ncbi:hypothetical protein [Pedobacter arcticus]|uniref:hypothetical protein n=1 Tax=Pedobacter arcticus TaxID=752140 RepID=UPI000314EDCE|nr:hypothetical protein [Pedobacter arcticus]
MKLLKYEYTDAPAGSYNDILGDLVKKIRHYHSNVPHGELKKALPQLKSIEAQLQRLDRDIGDEKRYYLEEILSELTKENEIEESLFEDIKEKATAILDFLYGTKFQIETYSYEFKKHKGVFLMIFNENEDIEHVELGIVKEVFRTICYKYEVIFIDTVK